MMPSLYYCNPTVGTLQLQKICHPDRLSLIFCMRADLKGLGEAGDSGMQLSIGVLQHAPLLPQAVQGAA